MQRFGENSWRSVDSVSIKTSMRVTMYRGAQKDGIRRDGASKTWSKRLCCVTGICAAARKSGGLAVCCLQRQGEKTEKPPHDSNWKKMDDVMEVEIYMTGTNVYEFILWGHEICLILKIVFFGFFVLFSGANTLNAARFDFPKISGTSIQWMRTKIHSHLEPLQW